MTFYESNAEVRPTGAEIAEFVDVDTNVGANAAPPPAPPNRADAEGGLASRVTQRRDVAPLAHIYLNDHRAGAAGGVALARRCLRNNEGSALGRDLADLVDELRSDEACLVEILRHLSIPENRAKVLTARLGELVGRLKLNGRVRGYSPVSRLLELEMLLAAIDAKRSLWRALLAAEIDVPATVDLDDLVARASSQRARLRPHHERAASALS